MLVGRHIGEELQSTLMAQATSGFDTQTADTVNDDLTHEAALDHRVSDQRQLHVIRGRSETTSADIAVCRHQLMNLFPHHMVTTVSLHGHRTKYTAL